MNILLLALSGLVTAIGAVTAIVAVRKSASSRAGHPRPNIPARI